MKISILINSYNQARFLPDAIESALAQTHADTELIVVDDGSTDDSLAICERYAAQHPQRARVLSQPNGGQRSAYNAGFAACSGELVIFLDSDDWLYPDAAATVVRAWRPGVSKLHWPCDLVDGQGLPMGRQVPRVLHGSEARSLLMSFGTYGSAAGSANAYSADFLRKIMPLAVDRLQPGDSEPIRLAPLFGEVVSLAQPLGAYRIHKAAAPDTLLFNNAPKSLWHEYLRVQTEKQRTEADLAARGLPHPAPLALAPWEGRMLVLARRFDGPPPPELPPARRRLLAAFAGAWKWPALRVHQKLLMTGWMLAVTVLPRPLARRLARLNRKLVGLPSAGAAVTRAWARRPLAEDGGA